MGMASRVRLAIALVAVVGVALAIALLATPDRFAPRVSSAEAASPDRSRPTHSELESASVAVTAEGEQPKSARDPIQPAVSKARRAARESPQFVRKANEALLKVHIVARETQEPLPGIRIMLVREKTAGVPARHVELSRGRPTSALVTDGHGRAEFLVPAGVSYQLWVGLDCHRELELRQVPALLASEERTLEVSLPTVLDQIAYGRVIDGETEAPLAGARIHFSIEDGEKSVVESDGGGRFELATAEWRLERVEVELSGYAKAGAELGGGDPSAPDEIRLYRIAELLAQVEGPGGTPIEGMTVRVTREAQQWSDSDESWSARTDARGSCSLKGLPPKEPLRVELLRRELAESPEPRMLLSEVLVLEPGETRTWQATVGRGTVVEGIALDGTGAPEVKLEVWLLPDEDRYEFDWTHEEEFDSGRAFQTWSDESGRFSFENVSPGRWWLGVGHAGSASSEMPAADPLPVHLVDGRPVPAVTLIVWRGLYIRGSVLRPDGSPYQPEGPWHCLVSATGPSWAHCHAQHDGTFQLGPLVDGIYQLQASAGGRFAYSAPVSAPAGAEGMLLLLREGGGVSGRVLDHSGRGVARADVVLLTMISEYGHRSQTDKQGEFAFEGVLPGDYDLNASTPSGGWASLRNLHIDPGAVRTGLELRLGRGAFLVLRTQGTAPDGLLCRILSDGRTVATTMFRGDPHPELVVPAGELELRFVQETADGPLPPEPRRIELAPGEKAELVFDLSSAW